jgi:menaquinone-dependent protoporphyrinogen oxidase
MNSNHKILVAYATKYGTTTQIAETIGEALRQKGLEAEVRLAKEPVDLTEYAGVVLGSPVYVGRWLDDAVRFIRTHRETLSKMPVAYFTVGTALRDGSETGRKRHHDTIERVRRMAPEVNPVEIGMFTGAMAVNRKMGFCSRLLMALFRVEAGDFRDWEAIRNWGHVIAERLTASWSHAAPGRS